MCGRDQAWITLLSTLSVVEKAPGKSIAPHGALSTPRPSGSILTIDYDKAENATMTTDVSWL